MHVACCMHSAHTSLIMPLYLHTFTHTLLRNFSNSIGRVSRRGECISHNLAKGFMTGSGTRKGMRERFVLVGCLPIPQSLTCIIMQYTFKKRGRPSNRSVKSIAQVRTSSSQHYCFTATHNNLLAADAGLDKRFFQRER